MYAHTWHRARCTDCWRDYGAPEQQALEATWRCCQAAEDACSPREGDVALRSGHTVDVRPEQMDAAGEYYWQRNDADPRRRRLVRRRRAMQGRWCFPALLRRAGGTSYAARKPAASLRREYRLDGLHTAFCCRLVVDLYAWMKAEMPGAHVDAWSHGILLAPAPAPAPAPGHGDEGGGGGGSAVCVEVCADTEGSLEVWACGADAALLADRTEARLPPSPRPRVCPPHPPLVCSISPPSSCLSISCPSLCLLAGARAPDVPGPLPRPRDAAHVALHAVHVS